MSTHPFNAKQGPIFVDAQATGPARTIDLKLVLDTGATTSLIDLVTLLYIGFDPNQPLRSLRITTGSAVGVVPVFALTRLSGLSLNRFIFPVGAHTFPPNSAVDGLIGLDFLRGHVLTLDFRLGQIDLT